MDLATQVVDYVRSLVASYLDLSTWRLAMLAMLAHRDACLGRARALSLSLSLGRSRARSHVGRLEASDICAAAGSFCRGSSDTERGGRRPESEPCRRVSVPVGCRERPGVWPTPLERDLGSGPRRGRPVGWVAHIGTRRGGNCKRATANAGAGCSGSRNERRGGAADAGADRRARGR